MDLWVRIPPHLPTTGYIMSSIQKLKHHLEHLKEKHKLLNRQVEEAYNHYDADEKIKALKLDKLKLRHEMYECEQKIAVGAVVESQDPHKVS